MNQHSADTDRARREVVSFVRRSSRMRPGQVRDLQAHAGAYVLEIARSDTSTSVAPGSGLPIVATFGREAPLVVEIGFGTGESLVPMARQRPESNVLAFEVYRPGIARTVAELARHQVTNVRIVEADAVEGLRHLLDPGSVAEVWTFFADPWPKGRHHKRRLVDRAFADLVASRLRPGGHWRLATDWSDYADVMREVLDPHPDFVNVHGGWAPRWPERPLTRFERRGLAAGRTVLDLCYRRR